jgi:hypothetical protein
MIETDTGVRPTRWRGFAAIWSAALLFDASQTVLFMHAVGRRSWLVIFVFEAVSWLPWALATPLVVYLARRYPLTRSRSQPPLACTSQLSLPSACWGKRGSRCCRRYSIRGPTHRRRHSQKHGSLRCPNQVLPYLIVYALIWGIVLIGDARERTARLNQELSKAQLAALRGQMEPHFMFNTLNSITGLVREQRSDAAVNMLVGLSEFLRRATEDSHRLQVTLAEEVEYLQRYVDIQKVRFGERLQVSVDIPQESCTRRFPICCCNRWWRMRSSTGLRIAWRVGRCASAARATTASCA